MSWHNENTVPLLFQVLLPAWAGGPYRNAPAFPVPIVSIPSSTRVQGEAHLCTFDVCPVGPWVLRAVPGT